MFDSRNRGFRNERIDRIEALAKKQLSVGVHVKLSLESELDGERCALKKQKCQRLAPKQPIGLVLTT